MLYNTNYIKTLSHDIVLNNVVILVTGVIKYEYIVAMLIQCYYCMFNIHTALCDSIHVHVVTVNILGCNYFRYKYITVSECCYPVPSKQ